MKYTQDIIICNIKRYRIKQNMPQNKLADKAGLSLDMVKALEQRRRGMSIDTFIRIASALEVHPAVLMENRENKDRLLELETEIKEYKKIEYLLDLANEMLRDKVLQ